ncbi:hypothetical protein ACRRTK_005308 [Alexandromys fortis]
MGTNEPRPKDKDESNPSFADVDLRDLGEQQRGKRTRRKPGEDSRQQSVSSELKPFQVLRSGPQRQPVLKEQPTNNLRTLYKRSQSHCKFLQTSSVLLPHLSPLPESE